jgi:hypothetical protein
MNATSGALASENLENHSGIKKECLECVKISEQLQICKGTAEQKTSGKSLDKSPKTKKEECKHLRMRKRSSS